jgi:hypothetical protein
LNKETDFEQAYSLITAFVPLAQSARPNDVDAVTRGLVQVSKEQDRDDRHKRLSYLFAGLARNAQPSGADAIIVRLGQTLKSETDVQALQSLAAATAAMAKDVQPALATKVPRMVVSPIETIVDSAALSSWALAITLAFLTRSIRPTWRTSWNIQIALATCDRLY